MLREKNIVRELFLSFDSGELSFVGVQILNRLHISLIDKVLIVRLGVPQYDRMIKIMLQFFLDFFQFTITPDKVYFPKKTRARFESWKTIRLTFFSRLSIFVSIQNNWRKRVVRTKTSTNIRLHVIKNAILICNVFWKYGRWI